ncbi:MAG: IniB N-terminal domain-containing protein [Brooklawnia sp.]|jgi:hypothetical protein
MTTPLATIADAIIEFILSLLRDPDAAAAFENDPDQALAQAGLSDICATDVRAVVPVIVDRPDVIERAPVIPVTPYTPPAPRPEPPVVKEIMQVANNFKIDNRSTIIDQSVNQSIWAHGDVTQIFDQEAIIATGDHSIAAGEGVLVDNSDNEIEIGDVNIGNTEINTDIDDSFNDSSTDVDADIDADVDGSFNQDQTDVEVVVDDSFNDTTVVEESFTNQTEVEVSNVVEVAVEGPVTYEEAPLYDLAPEYEEPPVEFDEV